MNGRRDVVRDILTVDALAFFTGRSGALTLYEALAGWLVGEFPGADIRVQKTQISFCDRRMFACASLLPVGRKADRPPDFITVSFGLPFALDSPRAAAVPVRPGRWTHHVVIGDEAGIDDELKRWLREAHDFACRPTTKRQWRNT